MRNNLFPIAKEGLVYLSYSFLAFVVLATLDLDFLAFISFMLCAVFLFIFRNPERTAVVLEESSFIASSDGVVKSIEEITDTEYAYKIEIEGSYLDVALLRGSCRAKVESIKKFNGCRVSTKSKLFHDLNENLVLCFVDKSENKFKIQYTLKSSFLPIFIDLIPGQTINQSSRYGLMHNGITTLYLPSNFRLNVSVGSELKASESLIGYFS